MTTSRCIPFLLDRAGSDFHGEAISAVAVVYIRPPPD
jgi:hypothetical protein